MGISTEPGEELKKLKTCQGAKADLDTRFDSDWALVRLDSDEYAIPKSEGEWESVVSNRASAEFYKIKDYLCYARRKLWIPIKDEDKKGRKNLTLTEDLVNGCIYLADSIGGDLPSHQESQGLLSFYRVARGWAVQRYILRDEEDELVSDYAAWDIRNTYWMEGKKRLIWVCYVRYATKEQITDEYPGWNGNVGIKGAAGDSNLGQNLTAVYDVWGIHSGTDEDGKDGLKNGDAEEAVFIGSEYVKEPVKIGLDYLPIRINPGRATPLISDGKHTDNIKFVGESFLASNRTIYPAESRLLSYQMTRASQMAKAPVIIEYDSTGGVLPPSFGEKDPYVKGRFMYLDVAQKQRFSDRLLPPSGPDIMTMIGQLQAMESIGGLSPVAWGQINQYLPAQGIDILTHSTMDAIKPFKLGMESDYVWWAQEITRQFKNGDFKEYEIEGRDNANNPFKVKVKPKAIDDNWKFECELVPDLLRDKAANLAWAISAVKAGFLSIDSGRDQSQIVVDTDLESQKVARERARAVFGIGEVEAVLELIKDYAKSPTMEGYFILRHAMTKLAEAVNPQQPGGNGGMPVRETNNLMAVPNNVVAGNQPPAPPRGMMQ